MRKRRMTFGIAALLAAIAFAPPPETGAGTWETPTSMSTHVLFAGPGEGPAPGDAFTGMEWPKAKTPNGVENPMVLQVRQSIVFKTMPTTTAADAVRPNMRKRHNEGRRPGCTRARTGPSDAGGEPADDIPLATPNRSSVTTATRRPAQDDPRRS